MTGSVRQTWSFVGVRAGGTVQPDGPLLENGTKGQPIYQFHQAGFVTNDRVTFDLGPSLDQFGNVNHDSVAINLVKIGHWPPPNP